MVFRAGLTLIACSLFTLPAAADDLAKGGTPEQKEFFERRIRPLLVQHCLECHSRQAKKVRGELLLDTRADVLKGGSTGPAAVPGQPQNSLLLHAVRYEQDLHMPPKNKLTPAEIADLETWVRMGLPDPRSGPASPEKSRPPIDFAAGRKFWSFQPLQAELPPHVQDRSWPLTSIDHFILARLEAKAMRPASLADRRTLLRRVTIDLTGLPPTPDEITAFLKDASPDAFARVVDRLLASPAYGERWGRYWLDVIRYADTAGDNSDYPIPQMYRFRNWVVDAFNRDMPYDRFVREQLAGDLLPAASESERRAQIIATGYLANTRRFGSYEDARYPWHLTIEDAIDNLGKAFLGLTVNCCRCHDHKFDPLSSEDYYALYGFFSSTRFPWPGIELDKVQRDLIPLAPTEEVARVKGERDQKLAGADAVVKRFEADKAAREKELKELAGSAERADRLATLKKQIDEAVQGIKAAKKERDQIAKAPLPYETAYAVLDGPNEPKKRIGQVGNVRVQLKGDPDRPGGEVPRRFLSVLGGQQLPTGSTGSGRLELADWITDADNPLTARVLVNRVWQYHFGRGLVATPNDFGKQGRPPSHPELLDWLARRFIDSGWSIKSLHRLILLSRVYQLDSDLPAASDPDNELLQHFPRRRLDAEAIRDALLAVSGGLDRTPGDGPHPFPVQTAWDFTQHKPFKAVYESDRRSVYLMTQRIQRHPFLGLFDGPDTNASTAGRTVSTTPLQALFLMNNPFVQEQARKFAARLLVEQSEDGQRIEHAFLLAFGRPPTSDENAQALAFLSQVRDRSQEASAPWEALARALYLSNEFVYVN